MEVEDSEEEIAHLVAYETETLKKRQTVDRAMESQRYRKDREKAKALQAMDDLWPFHKKTQVECTSVENRRDAFKAHSLFTRSCGLFCFIVGVVARGRVANEASSEAYPLIVLPGHDYIRIYRNLH